MNDLMLVFATSSEPARVHLLSQLALKTFQKYFEMDVLGSSNRLFATDQRTMMRVFTGLVTLLGFTANFDAYAKILFNHNYDKETLQTFLKDLISLSVKRFEDMLADEADESLIFLLAAVQHLKEFNKLIASSAFI